MEDWGYKIMGFCGIIVPIVCIYAENKKEVQRERDCKYGV